MTTDLAVEMSLRVGSRCLGTEDGEEFHGAPQELIAAALEDLANTPCRAATSDNFRLVLWQRPQGQRYQVQL